MKSNAVTAAGVLLGLIACQRAPEPVATPARPARPVAADVKPVAAPPARPEPTPDPEPVSPEKRVHSGANTRRVIQCGDASCKPGEQACAGTSEWQCVPSGAVPDSADVYFCDDGSDCPSGETCCRGFESGIQAYVCSKRRGPETNCRLEICAEGGAPCPKGQVCRDGSCKSPDRRATCDGKRCPSERPLCLWSERGTACSTWEEFEAAQSQVETAVLRCSRRPDCGGEASCCTNALWTATQCSTNCDAANEGEVCTSDADCASLGGQPRKGKCLSVRDRDIASLPAWLKVCAYDL